MMHRLAVAILAAVVVVAAGCQVEPMPPADAPTRRVENPYYAGDGRAESPRRQSGPVAVEPIDDVAATQPGSDAPVPAGRATQAAPRSPQTVDSAVSEESERGVSP